MNTAEVRAAYDTVAAEYRDRFAGELSAKPFDRGWLDDFAVRLGSGRALEVGCGDGHVCGYLSDRGVAVDGLDLAPAMIEVARRAYPDLRFIVGDMLALPLLGGRVDAIVSFYSIVNLTAADCAVAFGEFARALGGGGLLTVAFHVGDERLRMERWWDTDASLDFYLHPLERVAAQLQQVGFELLQTAARQPYAATVEAQTRRAYVLAKLG
jgi:ubiquinone/menaquinone biosynthesis C-methylase UbiE